MGKPKPSASMLPGAGRAALAFLVCLLLLAGVFFLELTQGAVRIPLAAVLDILGQGTAALEPGWRDIVELYRLPRACTALLAGAALSVSGLLMQTLFRNPLADPFILGISSGASLGVALLTFSAGFGGLISFSGAGLGADLSVSAASALGAGAVFLVVVAVSRRVRDNATLLILGLLFGYAAGAIVNLLVYFSQEYQSHAFLLWTCGSFGKVTWGQLAILAPVTLAGVLLTALLAKPLNALLLGEAYGRSLGVNTALLRVAVIAVASILCGAVTAFCGPISFIGIAVPHLCRSLIKTSDHRLLLLPVVALGALLAAVADFLAQAPGLPVVLPLNAVVALFGAPVVIAAVLKNRLLRSG